MKKIDKMEKLIVARLAYGVRLLEIMRNVAAGDNSLGEYSRFRTIADGRSAKYEEPKSIATRTFNLFDKEKSIEGAMMRYHALYTEDALVGFTAFTSYPVPFLYAFGIRKSYRTEEIKQAFLKTLDEDEFCGKEYGVVLDVCNVRAIRFFEMRGFSQVMMLPRKKRVVLCRK